MDYLRYGDERGQTHFGWLDSKHSFSFGSYIDHRHMGVSVLRVINDDTVAPGAGFDTHGHRDMEIISYVLEGRIEHRDSMGNHFVIPAGDVQRMSAGSGLTHSEYNASTTDELKFLQIWIQPKYRGLRPSYAQSTVRQRGAVTPLVSPTGERNVLSINQDMTMSRVVLKQDESVLLRTQRGRSTYFHVIRGTVHAASPVPGTQGIRSVELGAADALASTQAREMSLTAREPAEALWFDLP